jgi:hypothetical protein
VVPGIGVEIGVGDGVEFEVGYGCDVPAVVGFEADTDTSIENGDGAEAETDVEHKVGPDIAADAEEESVASNLNLETPKLISSGLLRVHASAAVAAGVADVDDDAASAKAPSVPHAAVS